MASTRHCARLTEQLVLQAREVREAVLSLTGHTGLSWGLNPGWWSPELRSPTAAWATPIATTTLNTLHDLDASVHPWSADRTIWSVCVCDNPVTQSDKVPGYKPSELRALHPQHTLSVPFDLEWVFLFTQVTHDSIIVNISSIFQHERQHGRPLPFPATSPSLEVVTVDSLPFHPTIFHAFSDVCVRAHALLPFFCNKQDRLICIGL